MKLACSWGVIIYCVANVVRIFASSQPSAGLFFRALFNLPMVLIYIGAWCTLIFAIIEFAATRGWISGQALGPLAAGWAPSGLPPFPADYASRKKPKSYMQAAIEVCFEILFLCWLLLIPANPWLLMGPGAVYLNITPYQLAPVWWQFYWGIVVLNTVQVGWNLTSLWRGQWAQPHPMKHLVFKILGLIPLSLVLAVNDHALVVLKHPALDQASHGAALGQINLYAYRGFKSSWQSPRSS